MSLTLRHQISNAFPKLPATTYRLGDAITADDYGDPRNTFEETWNTWDEIENWQITKCTIFFAFAPADAAAYLVPRFMLFVLDEIEGKLSPEHQGYNSGDATVWHLQRLKNAKYENSPLNESQKNVIELFIDEIQKDPDYAITLDVGNDSLENK
jgi:hypothetical protein